MLPTHYQGKVIAHVEVDVIPMETVRDLILLDIPVFNLAGQMSLSIGDSLDSPDSPYFVYLPLESEIVEQVGRDMRLICYHVGQKIFHYYYCPLNNGLRMFQTIRSCTHHKGWVWEY